MARLQFDGFLDIASGPDLSPWFSLYAPERGQFKGIDWFEGVAEDPLTLHKYAYAHSDPVNNVDPSGMFSLSSSLSTVSFGVSLGGVRRRNGLSSDGR